jgi:vancomycin resistance protein YoaR
MSWLPPLRGRGAIVWAGGAALLLYVVLLAASYLDPGFAGDDAPRGVQFDGESVAGLDTGELTAVVEEADVETAATPVSIDAGQGAVTTTAGDVGLVIDVDATVERIEDDDVAVPLRPLAWIGSFFSTRDVHPVHEIDAETINTSSAEMELPGMAAPIEPVLEGDVDGVRAVPGTPGAGLDAGDLGDRLVDAADASDAVGDPIEVQPVLVEVPTVTSTADAEAVAAAAEDATSAPLTATAGTTQHVIEPALMRQWLVLVADPDGTATWDLDQATADEGLRNLFADAGSAGAEATFTVVGGQVQIQGGENPTSCCSQDSVDRVDQALRTGTTEVSFDLQPGELARDREWADGLGIIEPVASFTTSHTCCQNRVTNIHLIADATRGVVIEPGQTFSLNGHVGVRTAEKGYLPAGGITNGVVVDQLGGGISQFTTTLFNAAFFAGLDFGEYQAHSIYFSRYPYGREATLSHPHPDLQIVNTTPYGILIWPEYTETTITVTLYSTKHVNAEQTGQTEEPQGTCTRVRTERTRTYLDGRVEVDHVGALYRRQEGENCSGESSVPTSTTEAPAPPPEAPPPEAPPTDGGTG